MILPNLLFALVGTGQVDPELPRLRAHVTTLASREFGGRLGEGGRRAADYLVARFREAGAEPAFDGSFRQAVIRQSDRAWLGENVAAALPGTDRALRDEWIVLGAHYDHLGTRDGVIYPGADDNATGVAMMLEVLRCVKARGGLPRPVVFVGFDREEPGLWGSRYFADHPPFPIERVKLFITADMLGRALAGVCTRHLFVMGTERVAGAAGWIGAAGAGLPLELGLLGTDVVGVRSDYGPFLTRKIPFLFFSTGESPAYHTPEDIAETVDYPKVEAASRLIHRVLVAAGTAPKLPAWTEEVSPSLDEARALRSVFGILLEHRAALKLPSFPATLMEGQVRRLDAAIARGQITPAERTQMVRVAQVVLATSL